MSTAWQVAEALLSLAAAASVGIGVAARRPPHPRAWLLLGACLAAFAAGDLIVLATDPGPAVGPIDAVYLAGYPALVAGLHLMYREGDRTRDRAGLVDAAIVAITAGLAGWVFLVGPVIGTASARRARGADRLPRPGRHRPRRRHPPRGRRTHPDRPVAARPRCRRPARHRRRAPAHRRRRPHRPQRAGAPRLAARVRPARCGGGASRRTAGGVRRPGPPRGAVAGPPRPPRPPWCSSRRH